jgi:putative oxidoreductase
MKIKNWIFGGKAPSLLWEDISLTALRVFLGLTMAFGHGLGKLPPSEGFVGFIGSIKVFGLIPLPLPEFQAWMAAILEFGGGLLLAAGLMTRVGALAFVATMGVAAFGAHWADPIVAKDGSKEMALLYLFGALPFLFYGSGRFGLDRFVR